MTVTPITAELLADEQAVRLVVTTRDCAAPGIEHRTEFALDVCASPTCHCRNLTMVRTTTTAPDPEPPAEFVLDPFACTAVEDATTPSATGQASGRAIAAAIPTEVWQRLRQAFLAAKARTIAAADWTHARAEFPFDDVERSGKLVLLRDVVPFAPSFTLPPAGNRQFSVDEQYCVSPGCSCTECVVGLSSFDLEHAGTSPIQAVRLVDFQVDWQRNRWWIAGQTRQLTPEEEDLRDRLLAANPDLLAQLRHSNGIMRRLYEVSAAAAGRRARSSPVRAARRIGRNEPCPCGSGMKYKRCCLPKETAASQ